MIFEKLAALLSEQFGVDVDSITMDTSFEDLGADSLDIVEMTMAVEEEFGLEDMDGRRCWFPEACGTSRR